MDAFLDNVFEALASRPRRQILLYLADAELTTSDLAERFPISAPSISRHLSLLENAHLIASERRGQFVFYRLKSDILLSSLNSFMLELCPPAAPKARETMSMPKQRQTA
ncbi:winged helix-turn-helix transcriptional regulator [Chitinimonas arctica]|uniref:Winged helix-turn-helix transcriptional regulator n=1 Tax=Chitinimonas arctica TaxID=2594795 RepID=A0A516SIK6_9NEIS|nr:metalloregulator ArsR/SmtB family transcription factor [Chitinimonas arctica]QDQ27984.1 winged helix-turn-helix transcriptional regulator [Chitinimonas arctica]